MEQIPVQYLSAAILIVNILQLGFLIKYNKNKKCK
jgi:hypothetical protein